MTKQRFTKGEVITVDDEIALIEAMVEANRINRMVNIATERAAPGVDLVHVMTLGTPLAEVRHILNEALAALADMIGAEGEKKEQTQ